MTNKAYIELRLGRQLLLRGLKNSALKGQKTEQLKTILNDLDKVLRANRPLAVAKQAEI